MQFGRAGTPIRTAAVVNKAPGIYGYSSSTPTWTGRGPGYPVTLNCNVFIPDDTGLIPLVFYKKSINVSWRACPIILRNVDGGLSAHKHFAVPSRCYSNPARHIVSSDMARYSCRSVATERKGQKLALSQPRLAPSRA